MPSALFGSNFCSLVFYRKSAQLLVMIAKQVFFEGYVQGVGFRYTAKHIASGFDVAGWVRNLADGRVELFAQGEPDEVTDFISEIRQSVLAGHIENVFVHPASVDKTIRGFSITR